MKTILAAVCLLVASVTTSYADAFSLKVLKNGEVIASHSAQVNDYYHHNYNYTVKYDNKLFWCLFNGVEVKCEEMKF